MKAEAVEPNQEKEVRGTSVISVIFETRPHTRLHADPCLLGVHRPAWLTSGKIACGRCGVTM